MVLYEKLDMRSSAREATIHHRIVSLTKGFVPIYNVDFASNWKVMKTWQRRQNPIVYAISCMTSSYPLIHFEAASTLNIPKSPKFLPSKTPLTAVRKPRKVPLPFVLGILPYDGEMKRKHIHVKYPKDFSKPPILTT